MEVLPHAIFFQRQREIRFYETFFDSVSHWADTQALLAPAYQISCQFCVGAVDALHLAAAQQFDAEFVSAEKPLKPVYRAYKNTSSIY